MVRTVAAAVLVCVCIASPATAKEEYVRVEGRVPYSDLDLTDPSGATEFNRRVVRTAKHICRRGVPKELRHSPLVNECRASVLVSGQRHLAELVSMGHGKRLAQGE